MNLSEIIGKTVKEVSQPVSVSITQEDGKERYYTDENIVITFTDGTQLTLASWDYEGYSSGIASSINKLGGNS